MVYDLIVTDEAHRDLDEALDYIGGHLSNPGAASGLLRQVEACYERLRDFPSMYERCRDPHLREQGYRKAVIGRFVLIYRPSEEERTVYILRFFYGGRDYEKLI